MGRKTNATNKKASGKHTTLTDTSAPVYNFICKIPEVSSVSAGQIKMNLPNAPHRIIIKEMTGCLSIKIRSTKSIQELKIYSQSLENVKRILEEKYS
ncbi:MAG: hypothetical protein US63_C0002G0006 [Candidatus Moranbacteria bacterium GW2011_GWC2_37_8]|nr:MAG: hypothetical protein US63_C0002G0006 [Candidatus Moranbacteria bacterium GW2011_GWC2_37_8]KKQ62716.1 MAG: hypothetical protein US82_C0007G0006 [Parcubacteria group bacterium GW2011_GWC1_38_22]